MKKWWIALVGFGLLIRLFAAWLPASELITRTLPDDAFIYFVIARNLAAGLGATFDGLSPTNGFHPLWALVLTPIFCLFRSGDLPIHFALSLSALCDTAAAGILGWVVWKQGATARVAPAVTMALYLFNPRAIQESVNGLETGLAMLALAGCVAAWQWAGEIPGSKWRAAGFGLLAGLAVLARSDLVLITGVLWLAFFWTQMNADRTDIRNRSAFIRALSRLRPVLIAALVGVAVVAPWFAWSQLRVGTVAQSSAVAIPSLATYRIQTASDPVELWRSLLFPIINFSFRNAIVYSGVSLIALCIAFILKRLTPTPPHIHTPFYTPTLPHSHTPLWLPLLGAFGIVLVHTFIRWHPRGWYFVPLAWTCALVAGPSLASASESGLGKRVAVGVGIVLAFIVTAQTVKMIAEPEYTWQSDMRAAAFWLAANTQPTETVGAFNAGIYSYYSGRRVISLDGLVDWGAIAARREYRLLDYFVGRGGSVLLDHREYLWGSFSPFFGARKLELIAELPAADSTYGPIVVYRVH